jgi:thioesterase domain-containing protein/NAD(P)-dependent dehydrogenase (short-subunit alcohol dehydrogenase family)
MAACVEGLVPDEAHRGGFKERGVYLVTDGFAGLGSSIARQLAERLRARLVLLGPTPEAPSFEGDESELRGPGANQLKAVRELEALGAEVIVAPAPVTNVEHLQEAVRLAEERFGSIDGVIHALGPFEGGRLVDKGEADVERVFAPSLYGTLALDEVFRARKLDFLLLCSSVATLTAAAGRVEEAAAGAFLEAYAGEARGRRVIALGWGPWSKPDIGAEMLAPGVTADDGWRALERAVRACPSPGIVVGRSPGVAMASAEPLRTGPREGLEALPSAPSGVREVTPRAIPRKSEAPAASRLLHLVEMQPGGQAGRTPFFVVAGLFGNVLNLRRLAQVVGADRAVYGLQARGLFGGLAPHETFEDMARDYLAEVRTVQPSGPYLLGGFSGGGITAYEMARQLMESGDTAQAVVLLDTPVPRFETLTLADRLSMQVQNLQREGVPYLGRWLRSKVAYKRSLRTRADRLQAQRQGETHDFHSQIIEAAFYRALHSYTVRPLAVRASLFRPKLRPVYRLSRGRLLNGDRDFLTPDNGWGPYVEKLEIHEVPGDHDSMVLEPNVRVLGSHVRDLFERSGDPDGALTRETGDSGG